MLIKHVVKVGGAALMCAGAGATGALGATSTAMTISSNVPGFVKAAKQMGATDAGKTIDVMIWLKVHDRAGLDSLAADVYNRESPAYHRWIKPADFAGRFAPAAHDVAAVKEFFGSHGLAVTEVGPKNMYVRARGSVAAVNAAFRVQLKDFKLKDHTYYANTTNPVISGAAGAVTQAVYGLHNLQYTHPIATQTIPAGKLPAGVNLAVGSASRGMSTDAALSLNKPCFSGTETESFKNNGNSYPYATVKGNAYGNNPDIPGSCGYTPAQIHAAYNLTPLYKEGLDGTGQTIVIIDWCGSPTIRADANAFSAAYGLPPLTPSTFQIVNSSTPPTCGGPDPEINLDVEWAHAIAPGANITLVVPPTGNFSDVDSGEFYAVINNLGSVISGSYGAEELYVSPTEVQAESLIQEIAAVEGIAANFSTGDNGDYTLDDPEDDPASVSVPADSPYATGVGGISLALKADKSISWQTGWGNNITEIDYSGDVLDPPTEYGFFDGGSGGGTSATFAKPAFQHKLKGSGRLLPDISWLADPFTGGVVLISYPFQYPEQTYQIFGGTSLSCPMFSALWAIANQAAGVALGQAAPYLYAMPGSTITDIKPVTSLGNVTATYKESASVTDVYKAVDLAGPLGNSTKYVTAIWNYPLFDDTTFVVSFGTDAGLKLTSGWDNVTGLGVPNAKAFVDYFKP